jgi:ribosomal protein S18 acetylase RimI-like enzyme
MLTIRKVVQQDIESLKLVIDTTSLFPSELLNGMMDDYFKNSSSEDIWLTTEIDDKLVAVTYCAPERLTEGTFNLYLIAIHKDFQGRGIGAEVMKYIENLLRTKGQRILIVETSGLPEFEFTRKFYDKCDYHREAVIRDFYREGEDKIVFWKKLNC